MHVTLIPLILAVSTLQSVTAAHRVNHHSEFARFARRAAVSTSPAKRNSDGKHSSEVLKREDGEALVNEKRDIPVLTGLDVLIQNVDAVVPVQRLAQGAMKLAMAVTTTSAELLSTSVETLTPLPTTTQSADTIIAAVETPSTSTSVWVEPSSTWEAPSSTWEAPSSTWTPPSSTWTPPSSTWTPPSSTWSASPTPAWTPAPSPHPAPSSSNNNKKGLGFNTASLTLGFENSISWTYNWGNTDRWGSALTPGVEFCPMLWGPGMTGDWHDAAQAAISNGATHFLGFNEPDLAAQSNLSPGDAVALWWQYMEPYAGQVKLVSPAVTNSAAPGGPTWLQQFVSQCVGCHIDAIALHWYGDASTVSNFYEYFPATHAQFNLPIWITEFAPTGGDAQGFYAQVVPWLNSQSYIARYAAFGDFEGTFVNGDGSLTGLGWSYRNA